MKPFLFSPLALLILIAGCSETPVAPESSPDAPEVQTALPIPDYDIPMRNFAPVTIGAYHVQPMFEEEIENGHYNMKITGGEFKAVRIWVGEEDPAKVMIVKTELENDYQHGHLEVPTPLPDGYRLWIEIETPDGETIKGSTPLEQAV